MTCRPAGCSDIPGLIRLRLAFLAELHGPLAEEESASISAVLEDYFRRCLGKTLLCYLAEVDGAAVAAAMLCIAEKPASRNTPTGVFGTVYSVYTQPAFRRRGISAALMRMMLEDGRARGLSYIELSATELGAGVYREVGFEEKPSKYALMIYRY